MFLTYLLIIFIGRSCVHCSKWKEVKLEEEDDSHRFALEYGLWTPDPSSLVGLHEGSDDVASENTDAFVPPKSEAIFRTPNRTFVTVQVNHQATFRCQVDKVAESETVSWVRRRDHHLITLGTTKYTSDERFHLKHDEKTTEWTLNLRYAQPRDSGIYECQISTHPPIGIITTLKVIQPAAVIKGSPDLYAQAGSNVNLICRLRNFTVPPTYVFWFHQDRMINYDAEREISVRSQGGESVLSMSNVQIKHSGNYTCSPANSKSATISLHIIPGELPAAMQAASAPPTRSIASLFLFLIFSIFGL